MIRLLVCGSRTLEGTKVLSSKSEYIRAKLDKIIGDNKIDVLITGMAKGADRIGYFWAIEKSIYREKYEPDWSIGKKAGILRNIQMLEEGKPTHVIAFIDERDPSFPSTGTKHMINISQKAGLPVKIITIKE